MVHRHFKGFPCYVCNELEPAVAKTAKGNSEGQLWQRTVSEDTVVGYQQYLLKYPQGKYKSEAEANEQKLANKNKELQLQGFY